jgi:hypothetical protein
MVLFLLWIMVLTAPLAALTLTARWAPLRRTTSGTGCVATANDATAATVPPEVAGAFWRREHSREFKLGRGIVSVIQSAGPPDEELTVADALRSPSSVSTSLTCGSRIRLVIPR